MLVAISCVLCVCGKKEPIRIGFIAGLSGRSADLGGAGRNGVMLAIEQRNAAGGIDGRPVELVIRDDQQNPETAKKVVSELIGQKIELIIGPMTSAMAVAVTPLVKNSGAILLSPTVTTTDLSGKDDDFLRVIADTRLYSSQCARYQFEKFGTRTIAVVYDESNRSYSESWLQGFRKEFEGLGGRIVLVKTFKSGTDTVYAPLSEKLLAARADAVLVVCNAVDAGMFCQQLRALSPKARIVAAEWAATERFIELAGKASEGIVIAQQFDRNDTSPRYVEFQRAFRARFNQDPGFPSIAGFDAAQVALDAYAARQKGASLKDTIVGRQRFLGVQQEISIDRYGDANRNSYITAIRNGAYVTIR